MKRLAQVRWSVVLIDLVLVTGWVIASSYVFRTFRVPVWAYYTVVLFGILGYSLIGPRWTVPPER